MRYFLPLKSDLPSQQQTVVLLILLPQCSSDIIQVLMKIKKKSSI